MSSTLWVLIAFVLYAGIMVLIGLFFFKKSSDTLNDYFLGGRNLNSFVAAISAQASDMSGWLLMGLPGAVYAFGTGQVWIAVGLAIGTAANWVFVAKRLRRYTIVAGDAITIPQYFENRFKDTSHILRISSAIFITIFFTVYTASAFVAGGTLFSQVFGINYQLALLISVGLILTYTFLGGFSAVSWTDLIQGLLMLVAILAVPILAYAVVGGSAGLSGALPANFLNVMSDENGAPLTAVSIISQLAWGLGYFGMPHILVRFMAINSEKSVKRSAAIAIVWVLLSLSFAVVVGVIGRAYLPGLQDAETVFIKMIQGVFMGDDAFVPVPLIGGLFLCGILAAIMSTADSQLLVTASSITSDLYAVNKKTAAKSDKHYVNVSRAAVVAVSIVAYLIAIDRTSSIMALVSNAWAGFGAAFGALVLISLYWKRVTRAAAAAGIIVGGLTVIVWDYIPIAAGKSLGAATGLYSLVPGFILSLLAIVIISLASKNVPQDILKEFEAVNTAVLD